MAELATIARPYADALFKLTLDNVSVSSGETLVWLDELAAISANPQLYQLLENPKVTADQLFDIFAGVVRGPFPEVARNFLRALIDNGRVGALAEIAVQYRALVNRHEGFSDAVVYSAFPLDDAALKDLGPVLEMRFGRKLNLSAQQDDSLIGGIRVVVGDEVLDTSVKARLVQMKAALTA